MTMLSNILNALYPQDPEDDSYVTRLVVNGEEVINSDQQATFEDLTVTDTVVCDDIRNSAGDPYSTNSSFGNIQFSGSVISTNNNTAIKITNDLIVGENKFIVDAETGDTTTVGTLSPKHLSLSSSSEATAWKIPIFSATKRLQSSEIEYDPNNTKFLIGAKVDVSNNFTVSTDKFIVDSLNGNTTIAGDFSTPLISEIGDNISVGSDNFKLGVFSVNVRPQTIYTPNTDPGNNSRALSIINSYESDAARDHAILTFEISPEAEIGSGIGKGRCLLDMKLVRDNYSDCSLVVSAFGNNSTYSDILTLSKTMSTFNSGIKANINSSMLYNSTANTDPGDLARSIFVHNITTSNSINRQAVLSFGISPSNSFGTVGGRCLFDMRLVRNTGSNSTMVFSAYDNASTYRDVVTFGREGSSFTSPLNLLDDFTTSVISQIGNQISFGVNETNKRGLLTVNHVADNLFVNNSDPGDSVRLISVQNPVTANTVGLQTGLSFGLSPTNAIGEGVLGNRCIFDMRLARVSSSNAKMVFSTYSNATYTDITSFATDLTEIMTNLTVGTGKQRQGSFSVNYPSASIFLPNTDPGNSARTMGIINSNNSSNTAITSILSFAISPQNAFGPNTGQGRCLFDMKLVRNNSSNCSMVFSAYDNNTTYYDVATFSRTLNTFSSRILCDHQPQELYVYNTFPEDVSRGLIVQNPTTDNANNHQSIISLGISPTIPFGDVSISSGRCLFDIKLVRTDRTESTLIFSTMDNNSLYRDIASLSIYSADYNMPIRCADTVSGVRLSGGNFEFGTRNIPLNVGVDNTLSGYVANTDPGDSRRTAVFTCKNTSGSQAINIGFDISPQSTFGTGRCMGDLRFFRTSPDTAQASGQFVFSGYNTSQQYRDFLTIGPSSSFPNGGLTVGSSTPANLLSNGRLTIANTTASSSTTSGCATFAGGIGVNGASVIREPTTIGRTTFKANNQTFYISEIVSNWHGFRFGAPSPNSPRVYFGDLDGNTVTNIYAGSYTPFSGCHVAKNVGPALTASDVGKLFKLDGTLHKPTEILNGYANGKLCDQDMSKAIYGIICDANYLDQDGNDNGEVMLLSVGEGGCLVHDDSGIVNIECGDILVSRADGYARKLEDSEYTLQTIKYVVARARETYNGPSPYLLHVTVECG